MSQNSLHENNPQTNIINENEEKFKKFFYNTENLENIYNILKGEEKQLKKETIKQLIQDFEGVEYEEIKEENKNSSIHMLSKLGSYTKDKDYYRNNDNDNEKRENNNDISKFELDEELNNGDYISFEAFCNIFNYIYESSPNLYKIFLEGFCYMDKDKKSFLDIEDLKRCNQLLNQNFSEDELEGLLELAGKSDGKITFENFTEFLNNDG